MKTKIKIFGSALVVSLLLLSGTMLALAAPNSAPAPGPAANQHLPEIVQASRSQTSTAIIVDHTTTDLSKIPPYWIEQAKNLALHYAHTSHGSQIMSGIEKLEEISPTYDINVSYAEYDPPTSLPGGPGELRIYDGNPPETYIEPDDYWASVDGVSRTRAVADTGLFNDSMWSWCGQQSSNSTETVQVYLDTMANYEALYPSMRFILMTGHTDGGSDTHARNNAMVKQYALDHNMVLFDFADIEIYDPLGGGPYVNDGEGTCAWCASFCANHPEYCTNLPDGCAHTEYPAEAKLFCKLKGNAFWWMMARLAGWDGRTDYTSSQSGQWNAPATWGGATLPGAGDVVTISAGSTVTLDAKAHCYRLVIEPGATLVIQPGGALTVDDSILNQGRMQHTQALDNASLAFLEISDSGGSIQYRGANVAAGSNLGLVTVSVRALASGETCTANTGSNAYARRCFEVTAENNAPATLRLWALTSELNGLTTPRVFRYVDPTWVELTGAVSAGSLGDYTYAEADTPGFSHFLMAQSGSAPTAVGLQTVRNGNGLPLALAALGLALALGLFLGLRRAK